MQFVQTVFITDYINVIQSGSHLPLAKLHGKGNVRFIEPGMLLNPVIFFRILHFILKRLFKQSQMII